MTRLSSFDVFDTLLARAVGQPSDAFLLLGRRLSQHALITCSPEVFARARAEAEQRAFARGGGLDSSVSLEQIYRELGMALGLGEADQMALLAEELRLEARLLRPLPPMADRLAHERASGARVVYVSDMYLSSSVITGFLESNGLAYPAEPCYVSNEHTRSKESGQLFATMLEREGLTAVEATHIGNNLRADVEGARKMGLKAEPFLAGNLNRYEEALSEFSFATEGLASVLAGASRLTRLGIPCATPREAALRDVSAGAAAPLLVAFTLWMLREASRCGLKRLYFVARDGQILVEIARRLAAKLDLALDLRYLYGSRQAWVLPGLGEAEEEQLDRIFMAYDFFVLDRLTVEAALERVEIRPAELAEALVGIGLGEADWARPLSYDERTALREMLLHSQAAGDLIALKAREARELTLAYLRQEGMFDGTPWGMVDLGTGGTLHQALAELLDGAGGPELTSFYLAYKGGIPKLSGRIVPYFFNVATRLGLHEEPGLVSMIEMICSADHGTVLGYRAEPAGVVPMLKSEHNDPVMQWGYGLVRETIYRFIDELVLDHDLVNPWADLRQAVLTSVVLFWGEPTQAEAKAWSSFPFEDGWGKASYILRLGQPYSWHHLPRILTTGRLRHHRHSWQRGSLSLTTPFLRTMLLSLLMAQSLVKNKEARAKLRRLGRTPLRLLKAWR